MRKAGRVIGARGRRRRLEPGGPDQAGSAAPGRRDQGQLARGLVDHLAVQPDRAAALDGRVVLVGVQDQLGAVVLRLARRERGVHDLDLPRMDHPFPVVAERRRRGSRAAQAIGVAHRGVRAVDRLQPVRPGGHQHPQVRIVERVAARVVRRLDADLQRPHPEAGHEVGGPEDQRLQPGRGAGDLLHRRQPARVLDLRLDPDPARWQAGRLLHLAEQQVQPAHLVRPGDLGQGDRVQVRPGLLDHVDHVAVGPPGSRAVDPHGDDLAPPVTRGERGDDVGPRVVLGVGRDRVLEVEQDLVRGQALGLGQETRAAARYRQAGPPGLVAASHVTTRPPQTFA